MIRRSVLAACLAATVACGNPEPGPAPAVPPAPPPVKTDAERAAFYQTCWTSYNDRRWDAFARCYADNATSEQFDQPALAGRAAILAYDQAFATAIPDRHGDVQLVLVNGAHVASLAPWGGTHDGPLPAPGGAPIAATHRDVALLLGHVGEFDATGEHLLREAVYGDLATLLAQIGVTKTPARPATLPPPAPPTVVLAAHDDAEAKNVAVFHAAIAALNRHDLAAFGALLAPDYRLIDVTTPRDANRAQALAAMAEYVKAFPDLAMTAASVWGAGAYVVAEGTLAGTNTGDMPAMSLKATGRKVSVHVLEVCRIADGRIVDDWTIFNSAAFAAQLGLK